MNKQDKYKVIYLSQSTDDRRLNSAFMMIFQKIGERLKQNYMDRNGEENYGEKILLDS